MPGPYGIRQTIADLVEQRLDSVATSFPAMVVAYDAATQKADVQPLCMRRRQGEDGEPIDERMPVIPSCPVVFPGSAKCGIVWPLEYGERVWVACSMDSLDDWAVNGQEAPGNDAKRFSLSDAVVFPGLRDFSGPRIAPDAGTMRVGAEDGPQILINMKTLALTVSAKAEVNILGQGKVRINSDGDVFIQDRRVNPDPSQGDI